MLRKIQALVFLLCFSTTLFAPAQQETPSEQILTGINAQGEKVYLVRYQENRQWRVDQIVQHADGWEDLISRKYYSYKSEADRAQMKLQTQLAQVQAVNPMAMQAQTDLTLQSSGVIWPTTQQWSWDWEKKYAQWLTDNMNVDFYTKYQVATDCADVAYSARWIFARINGLPAANHLAGGNTLFTNESLRTEWQKLPTAKNWYEDKRFRAALNYVLSMTYTHALMRDSYPVAITPDNFLPGIHHLDLREVSGHTQLVHRVDLSDTALVPYKIIQSTTPRKVRTLNESMSWGSEQAKKGQNGFLRILWPKIKNGAYSLEKPENMPGYSLEQYAPDFIREKDRPNFMEVLLRLKPNLNFVTLVQSGYESLKDMFKVRVGAVQEGYSHCPNRSCAPDSQAFDDWSTPSRDQHITEAIGDIQIFDTWGLPEPIHTDVQKVIDTEMNSVGLNLDGEDYTLKALIFAWKNKIFSSDPNDEPGVRWGLAPEFLSQKIQRDFTKLLTDREKSISEAADNQLRASFVIANKYCSLFSDAQCLRFKNQELTKAMTIHGQTQTLQAWLEQTLWLNVDPQQTPANQWGGLRAVSKYQALDKNVSDFYVTNEDIGCMEMTSGEKRIGPMGLNGLQDAQIPQGFVWLTLVRDGSVGWALSKDQMLRQDFKTGTQQLFAVPPMVDPHLLRARAGDLLMTDNGHLYSFEVQGAQLVKVFDAAMAGKFAEPFYVGANNGSWQILDFTKATPLALTTTEDLTDGSVFKTTAKYIGLQMPKKAVFIERATGAVTDISTLNTLSAWSEGLTKAVSYDPNAKMYKIITLDAQFKVTGSKDLSKFAIVDKNVVIVMSAAAPPVFYTFKGEDLVPTYVASDEEGLRDWDLPWITMKLKTEGQYRLRNFDGSKVLYEGGPLIMVGGQPTPQWIFSTTTEGQEFRLISLKNPKGAAYLMGQYYVFDGSQMQEMFMKQMTSDRGLILKYQGFRFWVEFP